MHIFSYFLNFLLATISAITFGIDIWLGYSAGSGGKIRDVANKYNTQIEPPNWLFQIWNVIYIAFIIWYLYVFMLLFRQLCCGINKSPLFPAIFWFIFIIINVLNGLWIRLYIKDYALLTGIILLILTLMLYLINIIGFRVCWFDVTYNKSNNYDNDVERNDDDVVELTRCEVVLLRLITLNGLPLYAIWCTIASTLQWTMILQHNTFHWNSSLACIVTLSVLTLILLIYWTIDLVTLRKYFVYTWLSCFALVVTFSAILTKYNSIGGYHRPGLAYIFALLIASCAVILIKLFTLCCCPPKYDNPRFSRV